MSVNRIDKISEEVKREISHIIQQEIKDPRLPDMVSVTHVKVTKDLKYATVYVSVLGDDEKNNAILALKNSAGFIRRELGRNVKLRLLPELIFKLDDSIEHGFYISKLIDEKIHKKNVSEDSVKTSSGDNIQKEE
ncbi:MAG: 30S ribosome-binding factor RbfA [Clostridiales bacterium]|nr:30S ribosome-binding factor RbfA [Clostridiales bacterium]